MTPRLQIQPDWQATVSDKQIGSKLWLNILYPASSGKENTFGFLKYDATKQLVKDCLPESLEIVNVGIKSLSLKFEGQSFKFVAPSTVYSSLSNNKAIYSFDISPLGQLGVIGCADGRARIWDIGTGSVRRELTGHLSDVTCSRFLPSGKVVMTGGSDFMLKIWDLSNGECAATLKGHKGAITSIDFINRGRNFISSSRDSSCKLWDCASQSEITTLYKGSSSITGCAVASNTSLSPSNSPALDEKDFDTDGKIGALVSSSGLLRIFDIRTRQPIFSQTMPYGLNCCTFVEDGNVVIAGSDDGHILDLDLRKTNQQPQAKHPVRSPILSLSNCGKWFSTVDGGCFLNSIEGNSIELTGPDNDAVLKVISSSEGKKIFTVSKDKTVRQYSVLN
ncbi:hypothetical protein C9374_006925 [Naegleria lovaniensis]|uniref:Guanine nucleotide-binding protein subunit beta-like protein n=1 Tax=Naegleria lovaniensis TaxID=51637 RepID=A0AA88H4D9_NAELO|nr:uncharacterized protein C9374_006925 [Naegleria lovaniensis]KAG2393394.1 hypothetical protein C9374_006925 [Naegleria lovaniensis]